MKTNTLVHNLGICYRTVSACRRVSVWQLFKAVIHTVWQLFKATRIFPGPIPHGVNHGGGDGGGFGVIGLSWPASVMLGVIVLQSIVTTLLVHCRVNTPEPDTVSVHRPVNCTQSKASSITHNQIALSISHTAPSPPPKK